MCSSVWCFGDQACSSGASRVDVAVGAAGNLLHVNPVLHVASNSCADDSLCRNAQHAGAALSGGASPVVALAVPSACGAECVSPSCVPLSCASDAVPAAPLCVRFMIDGGSNCNLTCDHRIHDLASFVSAPGTIGGIANSLRYTGVSHARVAFGGRQSPASHSLAWLVRSELRNILSESVLLDDYGIQVPKKPPRMVFPDGRHVPLVRENGLWFVDVCVHGAPSGVAKSSEPPRAIANAGVNVAPPDPTCDQLQL